MDLKSFTTKQECVRCGNPASGRWIIGIDIGYSSVKAVAPNKRYVFPSFVKKMEGSLLIPEDNDIYYRDEDGTYLVGERAQDLVKSDDTDDTSSAFDRGRYYTKEFLVLARTAVAVGMSGADSGIRPYIQTGLPAAYLKEDAPDLRAVFTTPGAYEVRMGTGKWEKFDPALKNADVSVMSQPAGTLNSIMFDANGNERESVKNILSSSLLIADFGFGTFDPYGIMHGKRVLEESISGLGMKKILETASGYIYQEYHKDIRIPQMRKCVRDGYANIVDVRRLISKRVPLEPYMEKACSEVAAMALDKLCEVANYFRDYQYLIITGGTGAAFYEFFSEKLSAMGESLTILPGNDGNQMPMYMANVRGYYMYAYRRLNRS